jgi:hypothetical protein
VVGDGFGTGRELVLLSRGERTTKDGARIVLISPSIFGRKSVLRIDGSFAFLPEDKYRRLDMTGTVAIPVVRKYR